MSAKKQKCVICGGFFDQKGESYTCSERCLKLYEEQLSKISWGWK